MLKDTKAPWTHPALLTLTGNKYGSDTDVLPVGDDAIYNGVAWWVSLCQGQHKYIRTLVEGEIEEPTIWNPIRRN